MLTGVCDPHLCLLLVFYSKTAINISQQTFQLQDTNDLSDSKAAGKVPDLEVRVDHMLQQSKLEINRPISGRVFSQNFDMH